MPFTIRKLPCKNKYRVKNAVNGTIHSYATSLLHAQRQVRLMHAVDQQRHKKNRNVVVKNDNTRRKK